MNRETCEWLKLDNASLGWRFCIGREFDVLSHYPWFVDDENFRVDCVHAVYNVRHKDPLIQAMLISQARASQNRGTAHTPLSAAPEPENTSPNPGHPANE